MVDRPFHPPGRFLGNGLGLFDACPRLQIILGHLGEGLPYSIWRVDNRNAWTNAKPRYPAKKKLGEYFQHNFYLTTSGNFRTQTLIDAMLEIGADRIVNTLAAAEIYRRDTIAVDLGTATTFDCITGDGAFIGGVIAPGVRTGAEMLVRRTAKLPRVELERPPRVIGRRTETCLHSGIFFGAVDGIDGIVRRIKDEWQRPDAYVVATGGLATTVAPHCTTVDLVEPFGELLPLVVDLPEPGLDLVLGQAVVGGQVEQLLFALVQVAQLGTHDLSRNAAEEMKT